MKKRIFITIDLPDEIKRALLSYEKRWKNLHVKWTNFYKLHITVRFLGEVDRKGLELILSAVKKTASAIKPFDARLDRIVLGPDPAQARMFWAIVHIDANIINLKRTIEQNLKISGFEMENCEFKPHITLARARGNHLKGKQTNIVLKNMKFKTESIEIMESQLGPNIEKYKLIESFELTS
ncbi:MAG: RNA 2',3'-cyclic phosphodiesterase [Candidatus Pacebacteria bacterium]|nr:RNA 2',3'-cyclic phosphodiesterase [Candidatus Paceibacterota bacterium]